MVIDDQNTSWIDFVGLRLSIHTYSIDDIVLSTVRESLGWLGNVGKLKVWVQLCCTHTFLVENEN